MLRETGWACRSHHNSNRLYRTNLYQQAYMIPTRPRTDSSIFTES
jgi:hypothetical protein